MLWIMLTALGIVVLMGRRAGEAMSKDKVGGPVNNLGYVTEIWEPIIAALAVPAGIPIVYAMKHADIESMGNPCAIGERNKFGLDGCPQEFGIGQVYNSPDYYKHLDDGKGITSGKSRRAYCKYPQTVIRPLTAEEMREQAQDLIDIIKMSRAQVDHYMVINGITWGARDYWRCVKMYHALPSLVHDGLAMVKTRLGLPPNDWAEFRRTFVQIKPSAGYDASKPKDQQSAFYRALQNAEETGGVVKEEKVVS